MGNYNNYGTLDGLRVHIPTPEERSLRALLRLASAIVAEQGAERRLDLAERVAIGDMPASAALEAAEAIEQLALGYIRGYTAEHKTRA